MHNGGQQAAHNAAPHESATAPYPHAHALSDYVRSRITNREEPYYVLLDEVQYAISDEEMRGEEPPRLYGVINGLLRMRNGLRRSQELDDLVDVLASSIGALTNPPKIKATFASVLHSGISTNTIMQYIGHLEDAFVIEEARRFDVKGRKYIGSPKKYYFEDMGLRNARLGFCQIEQTHIMENIVYNELRTRGYNVDVGVVDRRGTSEGVPYRKRLEVDFVANLGNRRCYIQSAYQLPTPEKVAQEKPRCSRSTTASRRSSSYATWSNPSATSTASSR